MKIRKISKAIYHIQYEDQRKMCEDMIRFSEFEESPKFAGRPFTLGEFRSWYAEHYKKWSFYTDWSGFNIPGHILDVFRCGIFDPLTDGEKNILHAIPSQLYKYALIATYGNDKDTLSHEKRHALYYVDDAYRINVNKVIGRYEKELECVKSFLRRKGYNKKVQRDEIHAYVGADSKYLDDNGISYPKKMVLELNKLIK